MGRKKLILMGGGDRGVIYSKYAAAHPEEFEIVAVAEPIPARRERLKEMLHLPKERCFESWEQLLGLPRLADGAIIATMDRDHYAPAMKAIEKGYNLLLEKPISPSPEECLKLAAYAQKRGVWVIVCHVLRFTPFFTCLKELIDGGAIGEIVSVVHTEGVGNIHQSHSFVRGNWGNSEKSSFMLLQKSCHDLDILQWLIGKRCKRIQSFGALRYFRQENAPKGSPEYCIEGCPHKDTCPYDAVKLYLEDENNLWFRSAAAKCPQPTQEQVARALRTTQYGKCIYKCDNDVVDHQTVNMEFEDDTTVAFTMCAFNKGGRRIRIMGTKGEITGDMDELAAVEVYDFLTKTKKTHDLSGKGGASGHGGGDEGIMKAFYQYLSGAYTGKSVCGIDASAYNHMLVFAAEASRNTGAVVDVDSFIEGILGKIEEDL